MNAIVAVNPIRENYHYLEEHASFNEAPPQCFELSNLKLELETICVDEFATALNDYPEALFLTPHKNSKGAEASFKIWTWKYLTEKKILTNNRNQPHHPPKTPLKYVEPDWQQIRTAIRNAQNAIRKGECYLINLSIKIKILTPIKSWFHDSEFYSRWHHYKPRFGVFIPEHIMAFSPERFIHKTSEGILFTEPIKGTSTDCPESLWNSQKEVAEQTMVTDLLRNDLNQVCLPGTVKVTQAFEVQKHAALFQMYSKIQGVLADNQSMSWWKHLWPAGSVTGTPKKRCLELIEELESEPRKYYTGTVGWKHNHTLDSCIAIRSFFAYPDFSTHVGVGVTILSDPDQEIEELKRKLESFL